MESFASAYKPDKKHLWRHGLLHVFPDHLAFHSRQPFGIVTDHVIPLDVRWPRNAMADIVRLNSCCVQWSCRV